MILLQMRSMGEKAPTDATDTNSSDSLFCLSSRGNKDRTLNVTKEGVDEHLS